MSGSQDLFKRCALLVIGQILPEVSVLSYALRHMVRGLMMAVVTGILFSALILWVCYGLYVWLVMGGTSVMMAFAASFGALLVCMLLCCWFTKRHFCRVRGIARHACHFPKGQFGKHAAEVFEGFLEGFLSSNTVHSGHCGEKNHSCLKCKCD